MKKRYQKWILVAVWALVIFLFSSQNGDSSGNNNRIIIEILNKIGINLNALFNGYGDFIIRKLGHFTEFFILYFLIFNALSLDLSFRGNIAISLIVVFLYACSDETHQMFIAERGPSFKDVMIDTGGGVLCMLIKCMKYSREKGC